MTSIQSYDCKDVDIVFQRDFTKGWNPSEFSFVFGLDGAESQNSTNGLTVSSVPFTATTPIGNEHVKWLRFYKNPYVLPSTHETIFEAVMSMRQVIDPNTIPPLMAPRIRNIRDDIRLCSAAFNVIDTQTWMVFDYILSDTAIYAFYERLPFGKPNPSNPTAPDYAAFSNAVLVRKRSGADPLNDTVRLGIGLNPKYKTVTWYIDGEQVFQWNRVGMRMPEEYRMLDHGGPEVSVFPTQAFFGMGTFSLLDMALPHNYDRTLVNDVGSEKNINQSHLVQLD
ncbi:MAG TPA: DUF6081 family protein, partial [Allocoleopsis sp.]